MRAARLHAARDIRIEEIPVPELGPREVLVRVRAVALCRSDVDIYEAGQASGGVVPDHPLIQGHEFSGDLVALGEAAQAPPVGTRVAVEPSWPCHQCDMCQAGYSNVCRNIVFPSYPQRDGALAEYIACPDFSVCALPDSVGYVEGALVEPLGVGIHAVRLAELRAEQSVAILGAGAIGICVLLVARLQGVQRLLVVEPVEGRRRGAREWGAEPAVAGYEELLANGGEADVVFECSGDNAALGQACALTRPEGKVIMVGIPHPDEVCFDASLPRRRELRVIFSRRSRGTLEEAVAMLAQGRVDLRRFPVREFSLEHTQEALELTASRPGDMLRAIVCA